MHIPSSTYRVQLHKGFTLKDLQRLVQYLDTLGISTVYASPVLTATPGSTHGYDVTDPHAVNPEVGTYDELRTVVKDLRKKGINWLQDIVPNHMAFHTSNSRLMDVLERGPVSSYYNYFDIDWDHPDADLKGKVMVPFLGDELTACLSNSDIQLDVTDRGFFIRYFDTLWPLSLPAYSHILSALERDGTDSLLPSIVRKVVTAAEGPDRETWDSTKREFFAAIFQDQSMKDKLNNAIDEINGDPSRLKILLDHQYYRLTYWKETDRRINYRRFFTVNELICLRMEDEAVFDEYHTYLEKLYREKLATGFRIDHIDGLRDPSHYTRELRNLMGDSCYIIAEKILEAHEDIPSRWPLQGTSGYEFLSVLNQLLTYRKGARELLAFYHDLVPAMPPYRKLIFESKKLILTTYLRGEWENLTHMFVSLGLAGDHDRERIKEALALFMLCLPVYRIYPDRMPVKGGDLMILHEAFNRARAQGHTCAEALQHLQDLFTGAPEGDQADRILQFLQRLMQFTGPLTAKGVEDTTFYIYNPLISHDEVGDSPAPLGMTVQRFHDKMIKRKAATPLSLNATATHDTKRGEDARVRINVLSRIPEIWKAHVTHWIDINSVFRISINGKTVPDLNDEYFIYQSMLGGFPEDFKVSEEWVERVHAYLNKALREAKVNSNWSDPDEEYETACKEFVQRILDPEHMFLNSFTAFVKTVCEHAMVYSLSQTLIKLTAPGIPDIYQGCELWDLSFVDPDNRRPVDFDKRMEFLFQLVVREEKGKDAVFAYLEENRDAGIEKLYLTWKVLSFRKSHPLLFTDGEYLPLTITGKELTAAAYARSYRDAWALVIFPLGLVGRSIQTTENFSDQFVILPEEAPDEWLNILTGEAVKAANQIPLQSLFDTFPVALLVSEPAENTGPSATTVKPTTF